MTKKKKKEEQRLAYEKILTEYLIDMRRKYGNMAFYDPRPRQPISFEVPEVNLKK